jgi:hypothetical protein
MILIHHVSKIIILLTVFPFCESHNAQAYGQMQHKTNNNLRSWLLARTLRSSLSTTFIKSTLTTSDEILTIKSLIMPLQIKCSLETQVVYAYLIVQHRLFLFQAMSW